MMTSDLNASETGNLKQKASGQDGFPGVLVLEIGRFFLGAPYQTGTLEMPGREKLVVNLHAFDCTTFVETVLALARCAAAGNFSPLPFRKNLKQLRYRRGNIDGYASRLHYFTDWLADNQKKKKLKDVSRDLGGRPHRKKINFMTAHRDLYAGLKNEIQLNQMMRVEKNLSRRVFYIIDKNRVSRRQAAIQQGDLIAFATNQEGLDVAHVGFAVRRGGHLHLLHASSEGGAVAVSPETLPAYLKRHKTFTGILVARFS